MFDLGGPGAQAAFSKITGTAAKADLLPRDLVGQVSQASVLSRAWAGMKAAFDAKTTLSQLGDSSNWQALGTALANGRLATRLKSFVSMGSPEIAESVEASEKALGHLNDLWIAKNAAASLAEVQTEFRVVQSMAVGTDSIVGHGELAGLVLRERTRPDTGR